MLQVPAFRCLPQCQDQYRAEVSDEHRRAARFSGLTQGIEIGVDWTWLDRVSRKKSVNLSIAVFRLGPTLLYATCSSVACIDDDDVYAVNLKFND